MKGKLLDGALAVRRSQPSSSFPQDSQPGAPGVSARPRDREGIWIARIVAISQRGQPLLQIDDEPLAAMHSAQTMVDLCAADVGCKVVVQFERADGNRPVILGRLRAPSRDPERITSSPTPSRPVIEVDGETVRINGEKEIVLRCGDASITLTRAGKVLIKGAYVSSRSSGTNRIKGGSVQIN